MTIEQSKPKEENAAPVTPDPITPVHVKDAVPVQTTDSLGEQKPTDAKQDQEPKKGGDPTEPAPPEKADEVPTDAPVSENDQVAGMVADAGLTPKELRATMEENNGRVPVAAMKALVEKHGESVAALVADRLGDMYTAGKSAVEEANTALYKDFEQQFAGAEEGSGKQHFANAKDWAVQNLPEGERAGISELLQSTNEVVREMGVKRLAEAYQNSDNYEQAAGLLSGDNLVTNKITVLSKEGYQREVSKLMDSGYGYNSPEVKALQNRRNAAIARGQ